jgi:UDP-perosamine 4-acetyltransferase
VSERSEVAPSVDGPDLSADVVVVGSGGHALVCIDVLRAAGRRVVGCVHVEGRQVEVDVPVLGTVEHLGEIVTDDTAVFVAVMENRARQMLTSEVTSLGARLVTAISPHAVVSPSARIGAGALLLPGTVVAAKATIGDGAIVNANAAVDHEGSIGAFAHVAPGASLAGYVTVGDGALIGVGGERHARAHDRGVVDGRRRLRRGTRRAAGRHGGRGAGQDDLRKRGHAVTGVRRTYVEQRLPPCQTAPVS